MKTELKGFQGVAAEELLQKVQKARRDAADELQAVVLSSPTGSGKTVTITQVMEWLMNGSGSVPPNPEAVFLWVSDSPELNRQSRDKLLAHSDIFKPSRLIIVEPPFSQARFDPGYVYFLNTQKLSRDSLLTTTGDGRDYTIWETIQNTAAVAPASFYMILDEAHRGMGESATARNRAATIVQRFIKGEPAVGLSPVPLVLGMSATPEKFNRLIEGTGRTKREQVIESEDVRLSGLLKDRIKVYFPDEDQPSDWSLLAEAARRWKDYRERWAAYCRSQQIEPVVEPVLVVQVEDGNKTRRTKTDLDTAVEVLERELGSFGIGGLRHCFQEDGDLIANDRTIRKIELSKIQDDPSVRVVFFKMALTTGWDCPRAEVMMSFRRAVDHDLIAQLVGRMVRTPLACSIETDDVLNGVSLYLPHYDRAGVDAILKKLSSPDPEDGVGITVERGRDMVTLKKDPAKAHLFDVLETLPSYTVERIPKTSEIRRLMKLARRLTMFDGIDEEALAGAKTLIVDSLMAQLDRLKGEPEFAAKVAQDREISLREVTIEAGLWKEVEAGQHSIPATDENIDDLFGRCERMLGEGLHMEFWKRHPAVAEEPQRAKLELYAVLTDQEAWRALERACGERIDSLVEAHKATVNALPVSRREPYRLIRRMARRPQPETLTFPDDFEVRRQEPLWREHLYVDDNGQFGWKPTGWEEDILTEELKGEGTIGWLRNFDRKKWSLTVPYEMGGEDRPTYPDILVLRDIKGKIVVDLFEPHNTGFTDSWQKAVGLAKYAQEHGDHYRRIEFIRKEAGKYQRLELHRRQVREKVLAVNSAAHLEQLFAE